MTVRIDGDCYKGMIDYAMRNLSKHCQEVNQMNVFPVPDGDTGTNMVTTIKKGLFVLDKSQNDLSDVSKKFANSVVFEARGNSGVIVSQFFKGFSETFFDTQNANSELLIKAFENGVQSAYGSVANPVEGTMLTVLKDAANAVKLNYTSEQSIDNIISSFVENARVSLENTPELLPALKESGVVDSGGAGIVYLFEGMEKYLDGETLETEEQEEVVQTVDYTLFNRKSCFEFGYCTELLIQLLDGYDKFIYNDFKAKLNELGDSVVTSCEGDKVRIHIHTKKPEEIFTYCHKYGEFLSLKVENMTVQHSELAKNILCSNQKNNGKFSVVSVAFDRSVQKMFLDMGADVVIYSEEGASIKDYIDAFDNVRTNEILVFPNSSDSVLAAMQAKNIYNKANISVITSKSIAECYASLPIIDFEETDMENVIGSIKSTIENLYVVSVIQRKNLSYAGDGIKHKEFYAIAGKEIVTVSETLEEAVIDTIEITLSNQVKDVITIFHGNNLSSEDVEDIVNVIEERGVCAEVFTVSIEDASCDLTVSFE